jgi:16S rRNA (cytosine1402-N4)-methyltransferase
MDYNHISVLLHETVDLLDVKSDGLYVDCTTGGGGHSAAIAERLGERGRLICFDVDETAIQAAEKRLCRYKNVTFINDNFAEMDKYVTEKADGIVMDLGVSSVQLDTADRGFSFHESAPLDMRMGNKTPKSAYDVINEYSESELVRLLYEYGEEKYARSIVRGIIKQRQSSPVTTTDELAEIIRCNVPVSYRNAKHPCRKTFQAIRIEVNDELAVLEKGLNTGFELLKSGGRLAVITFHSLEDRIVKRKFAEFAAGCDCSRKLPCVCGKQPRAAHVTRKPVIADTAELEQNRRARSAKLRVTEKLDSEITK